MFDNHLQIQQFKNQSTWRKQEVTIAPHVMHTVDFIDTLPNVFVITNPNNARLKVGISNIPNADSYEFKVEPNLTETLGRPIGSNKLYILNDSSFTANIILYSIETEFTPEILKNLSVTLEGYNIIAETELSGIKEGITLPVYDNKVFDAVTQLYGGKTLASLHQVLSIINNRVGNDSETIQAKLDKINATEYSGNVKLDNIIDALALQNGGTTVGRLVGKRFTPSSAEDLIIEPGDLYPDADYTRFTKIYYMRAVAGNFTFQLAGDPADDVSTMDVLTLNEGECLNDINSNVYKIVANGDNPYHNQLEIVGELK